MTTTFEFFVGRFRMGVINANNIVDAHDQAVELCPGVDWRHIIVIPTTYERVMRSTR
jgi:hypothetical protein